MGILSNELNYILQRIEDSRTEVNKLLTIAGDPIVSTPKTIYEIPDIIKLIPPDISKGCTATPDDILLSKTAIVNREKITGNIPTINDDVITIRDGESYTIRKGYHEGNERVETPTLAVQTQGTATAADIAVGKTAWVNGEQITGSFNFATATAATATAGHIEQGMTAWVYGQLITGTLPKYTTANTKNVATSKDGNDIKVSFTLQNNGIYRDASGAIRIPIDTILSTLGYNKYTTAEVKNVNPSIGGNSLNVGFTLKYNGLFENASGTVSVDFGTLANLIGLTADKIKKGVTILGITGTYDASSGGGGGGGGEDPPEPIDPTPDPNAPYASAFPSDSGMSPAYVWGLYEVSNNAKLSEAYRRIYNAYYYNGTKPKFKFKDFRDGSYGYYPSTNDGKLYVYLEDLSITLDDLDYVFWMVWQDNPELMAKWGGYSFYPSGNLALALEIENYSENARQGYLSIMQSTFNQICSIISSTYGISLPSGDWRARNNALNATQKSRVAKVIHDFIVLHTWYNSSDMDQTAYPALSDNRMSSVCASYAQAFQYCCHKWGILCVATFGTAGGKDARHEWDIVSYISHGFDNSDSKNGGNWCEMDLTWDDDTTYGGPFLVWDNFNITTSEITTHYNWNSDGVNARLRAIRGSTNFGNEVYKGYPVSNCTNGSYRYNGGTQYGW